MSTLIELGTFMLNKTLLLDNVGSEEQILHIM